MTVPRSVRPAFDVPAFDVPPFDVNAPLSGSLGMPGWLADAAWPWRAVIIVVGSLLAVLPLLSVHHLPLVDYPNHLGRLQIYVDLPNSPALREFYTWQWGLIPNLAVDLLVIPFTWVMMVEPAANTVILLSFLVTMVGVMAVDRQLNGAEWGLSVFGGLLLYNGAFRYGFVNYTVTIGFALLAFALWLRFRTRVQGVGLVGFVLLGAILLILHLFGFGLYAVCVGGYEASVFWERIRAERWRVRAEYLVMPILAGVALLLPASLLLFSPASEVAGVTRWSTPLWKLEALLAPLFFNQPMIELPLIMLLIIVVGWGLLAGLLRVHGRMVLPLAVLALLFLAMPRTLYNSNYADYRLLCGVSFFALASLRLRAGSGVRGQVIVVTLAFCLLIRVGSVLANWLPTQPILEEYGSALAEMPPGAKLLVLRGVLGSTSADRSPPLEHVPVFAGAKQGALVPYLFTHEATPIRLQPAVRDYGHFSPYPENATDMARYDYVLVLYQPEFRIPEGLSLQLLKQGMTYRLFRVTRA